MADAGPMIAAAKTLLDAVTYDVSGIDGRGGNGGLTSTETIRAADQLRLIISRYESSAAAEKAEQE